MKVSLLQTNIAVGDIEKNIAMAESLFPADADLVALPEMFSCGFDAKRLAQSQKESEYVLGQMMYMAASHNCYVCGSLPWTDNGVTTNRLYCVAPNTELQHYDKRHLFSMGNEQELFAAGRERVVVEIRGVRVLLLVCYDLRFPVWSRNCDDYDAILYVANWPSARQRVWTTLLQARAIENQCYVMGVNRVGKTSDLIYNGASAIYGPCGEVLAEAKTHEPEVISTNLDIDALRHYRKGFAALEDRDRFYLE